MVFLTLGKSPFEIQMDIESVKVVLDVPYCSNFDISTKTVPRPSYLTAREQCVMAKTFLHVEYLKDLLYNQT
jgi:hypothetical protein